MNAMRFLTKYLAYFLALVAIFACGPVAFAQTAEGIVDVDPKLDLHRR